MTSYYSLSLITILFSLLIPNLFATRPVKDPEITVHAVQRSINASLIRRNLEEGSSCLTGNPIDDCWKCDSTWDKNQQKLADCVVGFGKNAVGGKDGKIYVVTDPSDNDVWIIFERDMVIKLKVELIMNSYKTIDGRGANVHITGGGCITIQSITNIIIHGINIHECKPVGNTNVRSSLGHFGHRGISDGDAINIFDSKHIWVDHVTLSNCYDGLIDAVEGSSLITISSSLFTQHDKVILLGHNDANTVDKSMQVTVAFNHFGEGLTQRIPRIRHRYVHVVNNDYTKWKMYAIGGSAAPSILSQGNRFQALDDVKSKEVTKYEDAPKSEWQKWNWKSEGDEFLNGAFFTSSSRAINSSNATFFTSSSRSSSSSSASDISAKAVTLVPKLTANAGALKCKKGSAC
ncbi:hypothetical protein ACJW30_04G147800 [Castanea mollissima]